MDGLPVEIIYNIFLELDFLSLLRCTEISRRMHSLLKESLLLRYKTGLAVAGMTDGSYGTLAARLDRLTAYQKAWDYLQWSPPLSYSVSSVRLWELISGVLALYKPETNEFQMIQFPSFHRGVAHREWKLDGFKIQLGDFTIDPSSDLLVIVTRDAVDRQEGETIFRMLLLSLETGRPHPQARLPEILLHIPSTKDDWGFDIRVSNEHVGVMFTPEEDDTELSIWDWKTGINKKDVTHVHSFCFLTNDLAMLSSLSKEDGKIVVESLIIDINDEDNRDCCLRFPSPASDYDLYALDIMSGPVASVGLHSESNVPFSSSLQDRLIVVNYHLRDPLGEHRIYVVFVPLSVFLYHFYHRTRWVLPWNEWGPQGTRILPVDFSNIWITYVHGMKASVYDSTADEFRLYDFSKLGLSYDLKKGGQRPSTEYLTEPSAIENVFGKEPIYTNLPGKVRTGSIPLKSLEAVMVTEDALVAVTEGDDAALYVYSF